MKSRAGLECGQHNGSDVECMQCTRDSQPGLVTTLHVHMFQREDLFLE